MAHGGGFAKGSTGCEQTRFHPLARGSFGAALVALALGGALVAAAPVWADPVPAAAPVDPWEVALQTGWGFGITSNAQMVTFLPRVSRVLHVVPGEVPGIVSFGVEGLFSRIVETSHAMELGGGLLLRYRWASPRVQPYAEIGGAMLYSDLRRFHLGARALFAAQGAVGVELPLTHGLALTTGYRFRHISNAGQSRQNPGLNSNILVAGVAVHF